MQEFDLIDEIRRRSPAGANVRLGIGDDAAVLVPGRGKQLVAATDHIVAGRHFIERGERAASAFEVGHLSLAVNLSDLAAMGAEPRWSLAALTLPEGDPDWLAAFLDGYLALAERHGCALVGGNLAKGPLNVAVTVLGEVAEDRFATRTGARDGDRIVVTGSVGDAAAALAAGADADHPLQPRLLRPEPRVAAGAALALHARAMIDISDGLLADLGHLLGDVGAEIRADRLPASKALYREVTDAQRRLGFQLDGGSDYELIAVLPANRPVPAAAGGVPVTEIGRITRSPGIRVIDAQGVSRHVEPAGWDHFDARRSR
jgi:thiamine-monophosphate kinase